MDRGNSYRWVLAVLGLSALASAAELPQLAGHTFERDIRPLLAEYCFDCHGDKKQKADLNLASFADAKAIQRGRAQWLKVWETLHTREMPPEDKPQPTLAQRELLADWIERTVNDIDCDGSKDPGRVVLRRLTRYEYRNTIRDLVGVDFSPASDFPGDDIGYGFDNIGDVLSLPPLLMEKYLAAAEAIVEEAVVAGSPPHQRIFNLGGGGPTPASKRATAASIVERFATRAFRRPVSREEAERHVGLFEAADAEGETFEQAMKLPLAAVLVSPHFLFRVETSRVPVDVPVAPVRDYELATRLSYFLWSTMPDDELFALAARGKLQDEAVLEGQVGRMLADPRALALAENFAVQWLQLRRLHSMTPDPVRFGTFTPELRDAMYAEVVALFDAIRREDRPILELIDADYVFVNEALARHYGVAGVTGPQLRRIELPADDRSGRGGVLTSAAVLTVTSNPTRTNPTRRGKWVLETVLGTPPPPPVPDVGELEDIAPADAGLSVRQRLELHRSDPNCAGCHRRMDPIGLAFEHFDAVGAWRGTEEGKPIDDSAVLPDGRSFKGAVELKTLLLSRKEDFARALSEQMLTYALGRGLEYDDVCAVREITRALDAENYRFSTLVAEIVKSYPFRYRRTRNFKDEIKP